MPQVDLGKNIQVEGVANERPQGRKQRGQLTVPKEANVGGAR